VLTALKEIIKDEDLSDPRNPAIILCSPDLKVALRALHRLHVVEIRYRYTH
jgi:hypothetical protein